MITKGEFMDIIAMHHSGLSIRNISRALGIHRETVKKHIEANAFPQYRKRKRGISILEPYKQIINDYLDEDDYCLVNHQVSDRDGVVLSWHPRQ